MALRTPLSVTPHLYMGDSTGRPLDKGVVYFGEQDKDPEFYPINLFSDDALTLPLMQPVNTKGGYLYDKGDMVEPHAKELIYSVKVLDSYGRKVFYKGAMMRNSWNDDVIEQINTAIIGSADAARQVAIDITNDAINNTAVEGGVLADTFVTVSANGYGSIPRNQRSKNNDSVTPYDYGAIGDGSSHKLHERYETLADAQLVYPHATSLDDQIDWCAIQSILNKITIFSPDIYTKSFISLSGTWQINKPLRFETNGFTPTNFTVPTIEINCKLLLDNFASGQECVVFVGGTAFNFIGNLDFDVAKKAKHGLMSTDSEYLGTNYFPKCTNLPRCYINNAVMFNVFLENSMFGTLPQYRGQGGGSGSLFSKDITTISSNVISGSGALASNSVLTVAKLPDITIDANDWVIVKVGEYYSIAKSAVGNAITVQPHIPASAGTDLLYIYGGGVYTGGGNGAGIRIESLSSLDAVGLQHRALYSCNVDYMCTEFTAVSFRDDGIVGGANINLAYYEEDGAQYIRTTRNQVGFGGSNIANATALDINKFHDLSSGRDDNGLPVSSLGTLQGMSVKIKGLSYKPNVEKRANNVIPNADIIDFNKPQHTSSILSNSRSLGIANVDEKYNELFGFDAQCVVVVGAGLNGAPTAVGFIPPADGKYKVNGSTSEVIFKDFASAAVFECIVDIANKNILISLVSRAASTQSPVASSVTNTADLPINSFVFFDSLIAGMPTPIVSASTISNIKTEYSWGSSGRANRVKQVLEFPESQEVWTRSKSSSTGVWGAWSLTSYQVSKGATASRPSNPQLGVTYYDTTLLSSGKPISWNGDAWVDALGASV